MRRITSLQVAAVAALLLGSSLALAPEVRAYANLQGQSMNSTGMNTGNLQGRSTNGSEINGSHPQGRPARDEAVDAEQVGEEARVFVQGLVDAFGLSGTAQVRRDGDDLEVTVDGTDLGPLVGPRGATLQGIQEITRVASQRRLGDHDTRLRVDVGGYRERRREALSKFASQVAREVVETGTARRLEPMSSADRKVVHDVLSQFDGVATHSEGEDPSRRVVIAPANA